MKLRPLFAAVLAIGLAPLGYANFPADLLKKSDAWYASREGKQTAANVLSWQSEHGDWPKAKDTANKLNRGKTDGTFDNSATTNELRFLARAFQATKDEAYQEAFLLGLDHILRAQYANGGWPQKFPLPEKGYARHITFNDNTMIRLMEFLREVAGDDVYNFVDADRRKSAVEAVERGVDCIVKTQVVIDGKPTVWCAQHDEVSLKPALARSYELPSLSGSESAGIVRFLMTLEKPSPEVVRAVKAAVAWYDSAKIEGIRIETTGNDRKVVADRSADPVWARFYDLETGKPFFCDRDGVKKQNLADIGRERRKGYAWYGSWGKSVANDFAKWPHRRGRD